MERGDISNGWRLLAQSDEDLRLGLAVLPSRHDLTTVWNPRPRVMVCSAFRLLWCRGKVNRLRLRSIGTCTYVLYFELFSWVWSLEYVLTETLFGL